MRQHKVEVTGNVNGETLIKKLTKAGKHAELWPEKPDSKMKGQSKSENKEKQSEGESSEGINQSSENDKESVKVVAQDTPNNNNNNNNNANKNSQGCATGKTGVKFQEPIKQEVRQTVVLPPAGPVTEKKVSIAVQVPNDNEASVNDKQTGGAGGSSSTVKKKKKKVNTGKTGNIVNNTTGNDGASSSTATVTVEHHSDAPANGNGNGNGPPGNQSHGQGHVVHRHHVNGPGFESSSVPIFSRPANESPPRHHHIYRQYPPHYYAAPPPPPQVVHNVSYHTAHPSSGYGASYYAAPQPYSYAQVVRPGNEIEHQPPYMYDPEPYTPSYTSYTTSYTPSQPSDSFELFSDENPNACSLM